MSRRTVRVGNLVLPPPEPARGRGRLATSRWGEEWIDSLETPGQYGYGFSSGHESRLGRARTYARKGVVGEISVRAGLVSARVRGSRPTPYRCEIHVPELPEPMWDRLVEAWARTGPELPADLAEGRLGDPAADSVTAAEVPLIPLPREFTYHCSCPDWGEPCKHAAALSYQFARALDTRPEALLLLRGRALDTVCAAVAAQLAERERAAAEEEAAWSARSPGIPAGEVFARARNPDGPAGLPRLPAPTAAPEPVAAVTVAPGVGETVAPEPLRLLAADAARRAVAAYACAAGGEEAHTDGMGDVRHTGVADAGAHLWLDCDAWHDVVRRAARTDDDPYLFGRLLGSSDQARVQLARARVAWRYGGAPALAALDGEHVPERDAEVAARERLLRVRLPGRDGPPRPHRTRGRLRLAGEDVELRWGSDGRWYPYRKDRGQWWPAGPPAADADEALRGVFEAE